MKRLFVAFALFMQGGGQPISIPISPTAWKVANAVAPGNACCGGKFYQTLTTSPASLQEYRPGYTITGLYTLTFSVVNGFPSYPGYWIADIHYGTQELCDPPGWGTDNPTMITAICPSPGYLIVDHALNEDGTLQGAPQGQKPFTISFTVNGWPVLIPVDKISLTFTPTN